MYKRITKLVIMASKVENVTMRISQQDKRLLTKVSALMGTSISSFVLQSAILRAREVVDKQELIEISPEAMKELLMILEDSSKNEALSEAFELYRNRISNIEN